MSFISDSGGIDPTQVSGLSELQQQVAGNTANISTLTGKVNTLSLDVANLTSTVAALGETVGTQGATLSALQNQVNALPAVTFGTASPSGGKSSDVYFQNGSPGHVWVNENGTWTLIV
jgi:uncharacterized protein YoxC